MEGFAGLVLRLRGEGLQDTQLLKAVEATPRTLFVPSAARSAAYDAGVVPIECGSFMEGADLAAQMLYLLMVQPGQRVLEIGTGSGFTAAVIARTAERVFTLDRFRTLIANAQARFERLGLTNIAARQADGSQGLRGEGTFDRILVTAAYDTTPRFFVDQLVAGGVLLAPVLMEDGTCMLMRMTKIGSRFEREELFPVPFQPIATGRARAL
ncbi:protein-L-isoaspartate(D-aspartate) O-methyltransferase [Pararhizobium mangrovi]|uniref:Protein-L-isoaspartate O-methyltransferase n=1 Tax=Pararhizobium mangrovi TaxID=2590452 RepID=A0A506U5N2_9HYPH|nr:protein-L-isoaspartate(D-aspartate) O-methyltransferase [Pararhizobium mangrovi]TPW29663.1 protein-L-isoaspartate(D-aspartate) O-methyltransferase [Pararhizobium mangrovi]